MALSPGARVGGFEILALLGAGGMGEVYRARDTRLGRDVALKVLPDTFAGDPERLARFGREARTLAALNHPHIAQIHGIEEAGDGSSRPPCIVMELVEGEDLAQRIARGAIPLDEVLPIAIQIADALEAAHEAGIIHRDLKPSNIKVRPDGTVKVLDFGLAKALDPSPAAIGAGDPANSPTITSPDMTARGVILGTAAYMAPEQARGKAVDRRADVWAFGCVLYEMLAGAPAFSGETTGDVISAVLRAEPARSARLDRLPTRLRDLLDRCLQKDPRARWQHMGDVRVELERLGSQPEPELDASGRRARARHALIGAAVGLVVVALGALMMLAGGWRPAASDARLVRFSFTLPPEGPFTGLLSKLAISPDGRRVAYTVDGRLFVRAVDQFESSEIAHAGRARYPFFSPDGNWLGFHASGRLQRVSLGGGAPLTIAALAELTGASWGPDDTIVFGGGVGAGLLRVPAGGGTPSQLTTPATKGEVSHGLPHFLPDGQHVVFTVGTGGGSRVAVLSLKDGTWRDLLPGGTPQYAAPGYLVFSESGNLRIVKFDEKTARVAGPVTPAVDGIVFDNLAALEGTWFAVSRGGDLAYVPGGREDSETSPVWVDRSGRETPIAVPPGLYVGPAISPDGRHVGFSRIGQDGVGRVWILDLVRGRMFPIVSAGADYNPTWTPDGTGRLTYTSNGDLYETLIARQDAPLRLLTREYYEFPTSWSADGRLLAFMVMMPMRTEIWTLERGQPPVRLFESSANSGNAMFSPAGPWLAYVSDETGQREVYVRRDTGTDRGVQASVDGGEEPVWSRDGRELFYRRGDRMMAVKVRTTPDLRVEQPVEVWRRWYWAQDFLRSNYAVAADDRFLMLKRTDVSAGATRHVNVALNWLEDLTQGRSAR